MAHAWRRGDEGESRDGQEDGHSPSGGTGKGMEKPQRITGIGAGKTGWERKKHLMNGSGRNRVRPSRSTEKFVGRDDNLAICCRKSFIRTKSGQFRHGGGLRCASWRASALIPMSGRPDFVRDSAERLFSYPGWASPKPAGLENQT